MESCVCQLWHQQDLADYPPKGKLSIFWGKIENHTLTQSTVPVSVLQWLLQHMDWTSPALDPAILLFCDQV